MVQICEFDKYRDLREVEPFGFVDLVKANQTSTIDIPLDNVDLSYNDIDDPKSIGERPGDEFETMQANRVIVDYKPPQSDGESSEAV